jgi:hypothetical protein
MPKVVLNSRANKESIYSLIENVYNFIDQSVKVSASPTFNGLTLIGDLTVSGNTTLNGSSLSINTNTFDLNTSLITLNKNSSAFTEAGLYIKQTGFADAKIVFDATTQVFRAGILGEQYPIVYRQETPTNGQIMIWSSAFKRIQTANSIVGPLTLTGPDSTSTNTGALVLVGGLGVQQSISMGGTLKIGNGNIFDASGKLKLSSTNNIVIQSDTILELTAPSIQLGNTSFLSSTGNNLIVSNVFSQFSGTVSITSSSSSSFQTSGGGSFAGRLTLDTDILLTGTHTITISNSTSNGLLMASNKTDTHSWTFQLGDATTANAQLVVTPTTAALRTKNGNVELSLQTGNNTGQFKMLNDGSVQVSNGVIKLNNTSISGSSATYNLGLPSAAPPYSNSQLQFDTSGNGSWVQNSDTQGDVSVTNNNTNNSFKTITAAKGFSAVIIVTINTVFGNLYTHYELKGLNKDSVYSIQSVAFGDTIPNFSFGMTGNQVYYNSNVANFVLGSISHKFTIIN